MYYKIVISETGSNCLKKDKTMFNRIVETFKTLPEVREYLKDRDNKKIFTDKNGQSYPIGYLKSFWNKDISHNSKSWHQTDWIEITEVTENVILL